MKSTMSMVAVTALVLVGCSGEKLAENVIERQIESETGEDVDIDFDDGDISIQTEDGEISIQTDDDGNISIQTEDGDVSIDSDGDQTVIESEEGQTVFGATDGDLPANFPADEVPLPQGIQIEYTQSSANEDGELFIVGGAIDGTPGDVVDQFAATLEAAGYTQQSLTLTPDGGFMLYDNGEWAVVGSVVTDSDGGTAIAVTVAPASPG